MSVRVLAFAESFQGINSPSLDAVIFEEYIKLADSIKLVVIAESNYSDSKLNLEVIKVPKISHPIPLRTLTRIIVYSIEVIKNRKKFDVIYTRSLGLNFLICSIIAKKLLNKKLIFLITESRKTHTNFRAKFFRPFLKKVLEISDYLMVATISLVEEIESYLIKIDRSKLIITKRTVDINKFQPTSESIQGNVILNVARIEPVKAIEVLINSLPIIAKEVPDVKLKIIGEISNQKYYKGLRNLISKNNCEHLIEFVGPIPHNDLPKWYNNSKIFVLTSITEGASMVTMEAMASGKPVVATRVGSIPDLISNQKNGFIIEPNNSKQISDLIIELLKNTDLREKIGKEARKTIVEEFSESTYINELIKLFKS